MIGEVLATAVRAIFVGSDAARSLPSRRRCAARPPPRGRLMQRRGRRTARDASGAASPPQRLARFAVYLAIVAAIVVSIQSIEIIPEFLADAPEQVVDLLTRMWPPDWAHYQESIHDALVETIHIATLGTLLSLVMAMPVGVLAAHNLVPSTPVNLVAKLILVSRGSVNSLVWALLFVGIFGPGRWPNAGDRLSLDRLRRQAVRRSPGGSATGPIEALPRPARRGHRG
jgi:hypothetical protein